MRMTPRLPGKSAPSQCAMPRLPHLAIRVTSAVWPPAARPTASSSQHMRPRPETFPRRDLPPAFIDIRRLLRFNGEQIDMIGRF
jgi:hypothetical protein